MLNRSSRNRWLDIVRALAIVLVVNCHVASSYADRNGDHLFFSVLGLGGHGVDLFFVLSGWLLGHVLIKEIDKSGTIQVARFLQRRWLRTLPAYLAVLLLTFSQAAYQQRFQLDHLSYLVFMQRYWFETCPYFGISWSLCVEEHFYLFIAPAILWIGKLNRRAWVLFAFLLVLPPLFRGLGCFGNLQQSHVRLDQCATGVLLAFLNVRFPKFASFALRSNYVWFACLVLLLSWAIGSRCGYISEPPLIVFTLISAVVVAISAKGKWWAKDVFVPGAYYVATRSYSMYLLHVEAIAIAKKMEFTSFLYELALVWLITVVLSEVLYRAVELPFMKLRPTSRVVTS